MEIILVSPKKMKKENVIIPDLHGSLLELKDLLYLIKFDHSKMRLIFLGDLMDRGPFSAECVWFVRDLCEKGHAECVLGNHDDKHIRRRRHEVQKALTGKPNPMRPMNPLDSEAHAKLSDADIGWLRKLPLKIHIKDNWYAIHGGLEPAYDFDHQAPDRIIRCRYVSNGKAIGFDGKAVGYGKSVPLNKDGTQPENTNFWTDLWNGKQSIVFGHHVFKEPYVVKNKNNTCVGIDTGSVYGMHLTAFFLERGEFVQVKAKRAYAQLRKSLDE